jgi:hypothetical protein
MENKTPDQSGKSALAQHLLGSLAHSALTYSENPLMLQFLWMLPQSRRGLRASPWA